MKVSWQGASHAVVRGLYVLQRLTCNLRNDLVSLPEIPSSCSPSLVQRRNAHATEQRLSASAPRLRAAAAMRTPLAVIARQQALPLCLRSKPNVLSTSTAEHTLNALIRTPKETHLVWVLHSNGHLLTLMTGATPQSGGWLAVSVHAGGDHSPRTHILSSPSVTTVRQASLFALEAPHDAMIRSATNCVRVASLGSRAQAQYSEVLCQRSMWALSAVICAPFTYFARSCIWATSSFHELQAQLHRQGVEADRICLCLQSPLGAR